MNNKVLIIDDDVDILDSLTIVLEAEGFIVASTSKGEETFHKLRSFAPDVILLDLLLSGKDGSHICREIKSNKETANTPVIMMSAHPSALKAVKAAGADDFIEKPFNIAELIKKVSKCVAVG